MRASLSAARSAICALAALALPTSCAACSERDEAVCCGCLAALRAGLWPAPRPASPDPLPRGMPHTVAAAAYEGPLARLVSTYKDDGRRDLRVVLAPLLASAVDAALGTPALASTLEHGDGPVLVVPVPTSRKARRQRGDAPLRDLARASLRGFGQNEAICADALRMRRRVRDQAGLTALERQVNLEHAMEVRPAWAEAVRGACCVLVDDVLTTGATLVEARRALARAGAAEVVAATVCATQRRHPARAGTGPGTRSGIGT